LLYSSSLLLSTLTNCFGWLLDDARDVANVFDRLAEEHERHSRVLVALLLEFVVEHVDELFRLVPVLRSECEFAVADDLVNKGGEDVAWQLAVLVRRALEFFFFELFEIVH
jgi:hypothetical protein